MLNRLFALAILSSLVGLPFLILLAQKIDGPATDVTRLKVYERCEKGSAVCQINALPLALKRA